MILLDQVSIMALIHDPLIEVDVRSSIDSTNNAFKLCAPTQKTLICIAEEQTQGRGQRANTWYSPFGENIYLSLCYFSLKDLSSLSGLSVSIGKHLCQWLNETFMLMPVVHVKWPNDILCETAKLAGILVETKKVKHAHQVVIGIGLNVNMEKTQLTISQPWTSLKVLTGKSYNRNSICAALIKQLQYFIGGFENRAEYL